MNNTKSVVESALLVALAVVLFLASNYLPIVGAVLTLLCPAPLVVLGLRHNLKFASLGMIVATLIVTLLLGVTGGLFFALGFGVLGVGLGFLARRYDDASNILLLGIAISLLSKLTLIFAVTKITGVNPFSLDTAQMEIIVEKVFAFYADKGMDAASLSAMKEQFSNVIKNIPMLFPALLTMASALDCWMSYEITRLVLGKISAVSVNLPKLTPFGEWRFPKNIFWALIASAALTLLGGWQNYPFVTQAGVNLRLIVQMLFFIQGSAVVWFYLAAKNWKTIFRIIILFIGMMLPILSHIILILGIVDIWWDLRSRVKKREEMR